MPNEEIDSLRSEVLELKRLVGDVFERVTALEGRQGEKAAPTPQADPLDALGFSRSREPNAPPTVQPPPVICPLPPYGERRQARQAHSEETSPTRPREPRIIITSREPEPETVGQEPSAETEYRIGGVILPRVGAAVVLVAIGTFVSMAASRGWIGEWTQFWLGILACVGFIGVGLWKRNEKEEFGQLLTGIGSCGLYLVFTAGHVFLHRYEGEVLVGLFLGLSLANLAFSYVASSRSFHAIGLIGGLAAALMPMRDDNVVLNLVLHFAIVVPAALIAARNRWTGSAMRLTLFAGMATVPALLHAGDWQMRITMLYGTALICCGAYALSGKWTFDPESVFAPVVLIAAACIGLSVVQGGGAGVVHTALLGVACLAMGYGVQRVGSDGSRLYLSGAAIAFCVAPWGFGAWQVPALIFALSIACAATGSLLTSKAATSLAWVLFLLGVGGYLRALHIMATPWTIEALVLFEAIASAAVGAYAFNRLNRSPEWIAVGACFLALPLFTRLAFVALNLSPAGIGLYASLLLGWMVFCLFVNWMTLKLKWLAPTAASWTTLLLALAFYVPLVRWEPLGPGHDALLLLGLIATTAVTAYATSRFGKFGSKEEFFVLGAFLILPIASRLAWVCLTPTGMSGFAALILTWLAYSLALSAVSIRTRWTQTAVLSWLTVLMAMSAYVPLVGDVPPQRGADIALILGIFGTLAVAVYGSRRVSDSHSLESLVTRAAFVALPLFSRMAFLLLEPTGLDVAGTLVVGWCSFAALAAVAAIRLRWPGASLLSGGVALLAGLVYMVFANNGPARGTDVGVVLGVISAFVLAAFSIWRQQELTQDAGSMITAAGLLILPLYSRLAWLVLPSCGFGDAEALIVGWLVYCFAASTVTYLKRNLSVATLSWVAVALVLSEYLLEQGGGRMTAPAEGWVLVGSLSAVLAACVSTGVVTRERTLMFGLVVPLCWALFTRLAVVVLTGAEFGMHINGAVTLAWSVFATALMASGFGLHLRALRYWSLGVFGSTLGKVFLVDMAGLDPGLRVGVLMVLGLAMLGVGYWYVRNREELGL